MKDPRDMGGEELRSIAKSTDRKLGFEIERMRRIDPKFKEVLDRSLALEAEILRRRNVNPPEES